MTTSSGQQEEQRQYRYGSSGDETVLLELSSEMEFYAQHEAKMMTSIYDLHYPAATEAAAGGGGGSTDGLLNLTIGTANKDEDESRLFEEFISLVVDKALDPPTGYGSQPSLLPQEPGSGSSNDDSCQQPMGGLHQSSSCSSLYSLGANSSSHHLHQQEQENIQPGQKRLLYASVGLGVGGSRVQTVGRSRLNMKRDNSLLRQQLQGQLSPVQYRRVQESSCQCSLCGNILSAKCILKTCLKSDEVLCTTCGRELTTKCILGSCTL